MSMIRRLTAPTPFSRATVTVWPTLILFNVFIALVPPIPLRFILLPAPGGAAGGSDHDSVCHGAVQRDAALLHLEDQVSRDLVHDGHAAAHHKPQLGQVLAHLVFAGDFLNGHGLAWPCNA